VAVLGAFGIAGAAYAAQTPAPPEPADSTQATPQQNPDPAAASSPHQREATGQQTQESVPNENPDPQGAASPHQKGTMGQAPDGAMAHATPKIVGLQVISPTGEALGSVVDVTMDAQHQPEYVVVSTGNDTMTAVPYSTASSMIKNNKVVMDRTKLQNSPQVAQSELRDKSNSKWRADSDKYWSSGGVRTASPGAGSDYEQPKPKDR
jgi:sporulation protein YlmC with PRC-barrel domain